MDIRTLDWSLIQSFLAVAETGSLSGAARALHQSQPTIGRHIKTLEQTLDVELFARHPKGLRLTQTGTEMRPAAEAMRAAMNQIALTAEATSDRATGTVRIACSVFAAHHMLPPIIADLRVKHPAIQLVLQPSDDSDNLLFREADIAVRMYRPDQIGLVAQHLGDVEMGVFAAHGYLARIPELRALDDVRALEIVGYDQSTLIIDAMRAMGYPVTVEDFAVRTDNQSAYWELVRAGCGIGFTQLHVGLGDPAVTRVLEEVPIPSLPVWLTAQETVRRTTRVDLVWRGLEQGLRALLKAR